MRRPVRHFLIVVLRRVSAALALLAVHAVGAQQQAPTPRDAVTMGVASSVYGAKEGHHSDREPRTRIAARQRRTGLEHVPPTVRGPDHHADVSTLSHHQRECGSEEHDQLRDRDLSIEVLRSDYVTHSFQQQRQPRSRAIPRDRVVTTFSALKAAPRAVTTATPLANVANSPVRSYCLDHRREAGEFRNIGSAPRPPALTPSSPSID